MIIIICEEFPSHPGGVAYFSDVLAKKYHAQGILKGVISLSRHLPEPRHFKVIHLKLPSRKYGRWPFDNILFIKTLNTIIYKIFSFFRGSSVQWKPLVKAIDSLDYDSSRDIIFFTYQVHFPNLFNQIYRSYGGRQWILYHGRELLSFRNKKQKILKNCKVSDKVIFNSKATKELFYNLGFHSSKDEIINPFLDLDYLKIIQTYTLTELEEKTGIKLADKLIFLTVCRLIRRKGIHFSIKIFEKVLIEYPNSVYLIAGMGPEFKNLKKLVQNKGLGNSIHFLGYIDNKLKYSVLKNSFAFLMPNYDVEGKDFEGFGISYLEAGYYNNVVIGGMHGGSMEALSTINNALSINPLIDSDLQSAYEFILKKAQEKLF